MEERFTKPRIVPDIIWVDFDTVFVSDDDLIDLEGNGSTFPNNISLHSQENSDMSLLLPEDADTNALRWEENVCMEEDEIFRMMQEAIVEDPDFRICPRLPSTSQPLDPPVNIKDTSMESTIKTVSGTISPELIESFPSSQTHEVSWDGPSAGLTRSLEEHMENLVRSIHQSEATRKMILCQQRNQREWLLQGKQGEGYTTGELEVECPIFRLFSVDESRRLLLTLVDQHKKVITE